jgi:sugar phosphate isomerase/epimerase
MPAALLPLACGDHSFPLLEHEHALDLIAMLGFSGFDLAVMGNRSHVRPEAIRGDAAGWGERLGTAIRSRGLSPADVFLIPWTDFETLAPNHPDPGERERARELFADVLELAARLGAPGVTLLPGIAWPGRAERDPLQRAADELQWRAERARRLGMRCSIEPHIGSVVATPEAVAELLGLAPDLELTLDYTHFVAQGIAEERVHPLIDRTRHVHARGARPGRGQCAIKDSSIAYERVVDELLARGYDGYLAIEYVWIAWERMNECDNLSETVLLRDRLRAHLAAAGR